MKFYNFDNNFLKSLNLPCDKKYTLEFIEKIFIKSLGKVNFNGKSINFENNKNLVKNLERYILYEDKSNKYFDYGSSVKSICI